MSDKSKIEWTDATWNPVRGCSKVSPGCINCYAETLAERFRWRTPKMIFVNSMSDLFHEQVPDEYIVNVARVMRLANWHTYQVLTKRSERMRDLLGGKLQ